jgi:hypothetical protein
MALIAGLASAGYSQVCTPDSAAFTGGVYVYPASLPCITQGIAFSGTVSIQVPDSIPASSIVAGAPGYLYIDSLTIDSITGFPTGISGTNNPGPGNWIYGGGYGCSTFAGTTSDSVGQYTLNVYGRSCAHGTVFGFPVDSCLSGSLSSFFSYTLGVCAPPPPLPVCTPDTAAFTSGVYLYPPSLPCINPGIAYSGTVSIRIPDSIAASVFVSGIPGYLYVDSMMIDSITGTPAGITVVSNPADTVWLHGGQYGCAVFSGTTSAAVGNYPIGIYGRGCVHGTIVGIPIDSCVSGSLSNYFHFSLNVCNPGAGACTVDTTQFSTGVSVYPASLPCITTGEAYTGQINIQVPATVDAHDFESLIPAGEAFVTVDSININSISGYPAGITGISNPVLGSWLHPLSFACNIITGTVNGAVTPAGNYPLTISGVACGHTTIQYFGAIDTCIQNFNFAQAFPYSLGVCYPAGITEVADGMGLSIYPNPNQGNFTVTIASDVRTTGTLAVVDQLGRVLHMQNVDGAGTQQIAMELGDIAPGAYILMLNAGNKRSVKQFVVR